eukprot:TRINITY_DN3664_c0_g2_i1.p1 TRINITY_DN3664_c0_g2~~TRINITY_DN3664_c0_g2_i1.p1  ORF type:complete len:790 (-),score=225.80 TRINITY_DN3664_c0_g2_i1:452-2821(-)
MKTSCISPPLFDPLSSYLNTRGDILHVGHHNMKRRNNAAQDGKRRPLKRNKISENFFGSTLVYVKLLLLWLVVLVADYFLEFRFEYLWPFWLLVRSIYDSFKYQGLAFSVFFICIALTSDMICFLFIPVHWLFFAASTYVWVQYVWHTEKGICLPTVFLWLLFVYIEAAVRLRDYKLHVDLKNLPFHLDLCRPFAAHCIGYPVVTLGFGFKSYVGYRMRQRRQKEIQKENETYYSLLRGALPPGPARDDAFNPHPSPKPGADERISNGGVVSAIQGGGGDADKANRSPDKQLPPSSSCPDSSPVPRQNGSAKAHHANTPHHSDHHNSGAAGEIACMERDHDNDGPAVNGGGGDASSGGESKKSSNNNNSGGGGASSTANNRANSKSNGGGKESRKSKNNDDRNKGGNNSSNSGGGNNNGSASGNAGGGSSGDNATMPLVIKLESDVKRLKCDLQLSRNRENELREQIVCYMSNERSLKSEISSLLVEKSTLEARINSLISSRAGEKQALSALEKRFAEERKQRAEFQLKLEAERKNKKEANAERVAAVAQQSANTGTIAKLEADIARLKDELARSEQRAELAEEEMKALKNQSSGVDPEKLKAMLNVAQDQQTKLEKTLSSETKVKMDLFSALGAAKRQLQINETLLMSKDREILDLKANIAEMLAVMPGHAAALGGHGGGAPGSGGVLGGISAAPGGFPATTRSSASSGLFIPNSLDLSSETGVVGPGPAASMSDLPPGIELSKLTGLGLADLEDKLANYDKNTNSLGGSLYTATTTYSQTNGNHNDA